MYITIQPRIRQRPDDTYEPGFVLSEHSDNQPVRFSSFWSPASCQPSVALALRAAMLLANDEVRHRYPEYVEVRELPASVSVHETDPEFGYPYAGTNIGTPSLRQPEVLRNLLQYERWRKERADRKRRQLARRLAWYRTHERPTGY